jgi:crotonobetainyl-CoA:carnitine CoA-transferase CaiB-like acyl-CoA transferase
VNDPRFSSYAKRKINEDALLPLVEPAVRMRDSEDLELALRVAGVPCARVNNFKEVFNDPQIIARGVMQEIQHPRLGKMRTTRNPVLLDHDGPAIDRHSPMLGEHSEEVLLELGYSSTAIRNLVAAGVTRVAADQHPILHARA